jgi:preprotein translocase subunit YajC
MEALIIVAFVLMAGVFFVILSKLQKRGQKHHHDEHCCHDHSKCDHKHD